MTDTRRIIHYYEEEFSEHERLASDIGPIEWLRTLDLLARHLPAPPGVVLDVGGATGPYSRWLLERGFEVHLVDLVPRHVEQARRELASVASAGWSCRVGDARALEFADGSAEAVLLMGPLYHLQERSDRLLALGEARRVLRPGGILAATAISRFASALSGLADEFVFDPAFRRMVAHDIEWGRHENPTGERFYFTTAYFHHPSELAEELRLAGFADVVVAAVEGVLWTSKDLGRLQADPDAWRDELALMRRLESEPSLVGASPHAMALGRKVAIP